VARPLTLTAWRRGTFERLRARLAEQGIERIPPEVYVEVFGDESFIRAQDNTGASVPEDDLFAGLT